MVSNTLHIISLSIPYPPDFGGAIDIFYKLKALHESGIEIILHCFEYNRLQSNQLEKYCKEVNYYRRKTGFKSQSLFSPYIVKSRQCQELFDRLVKDNYPILFEGLHTTAYLGHPAFGNRKQWVRAHNVEHDYYNSLCSVERNIYKKIYFKIEAYRLKRYNSRLALANGIFAISQGDATVLEKTNKNTYLIPAFHGYSQISSLPGKGEYVLYHGDLSVSENSHAAEFMIEVCKNLPFRLIIAGKSPQNFLRNLVIQYPNIELNENPDIEEMEQLVQNAGVILLPAKQITGLRLKLIVSLFTGRHCITSPEMVIDTGLEKLCHIAVDKEEWQNAIRLCMNTPFTHNNIQQRQESLKNYLDINNAKEMIKLMFNEMGIDKKSLC